MGWLAWFTEDSRGPPRGLLLIHHQQLAVTPQTQGRSLTFFVGSANQIRPMGITSQCCSWVPKDLGWRLMHPNVASHLLAKPSSSLCLPLCHHWTRFVGPYVELDTSSMFALLFPSKIYILKGLTWASFLLTWHEVFLWVIFSLTLLFPKVPHLP